MPNLENTLEHNITAQEVLEETILSPDENLLGIKEELDHFFPEEFINLATLESNMNSSESNMNSSESIMNSINNDLFTSLDNDDITDGLDDLLVDTDEDVVGQNACQIPNDFFYDAVTSAPAPENRTIAEPISDTAAVVPDVVPESPTSEPAPENHTISEPISDTAAVLPDVVSESPMSVPEAFLTLLEDLEKFAESNLEPTCRKRSLEMNDESNDPTAPPVSKKKRQPSNSSRDVMEHQVSEKSNEEREKNNDACKKSRAKKKANRNELFEQEKELLEENKVLKSKVEELTKAVTDLRNYLVNRLR